MVKWTVYTSKSLVLIQNEFGYFLIAFAPLPIPAPSYSGSEGSWWQIHFAEVKCMWNVCVKIKLHNLR